MTSIPFKSCISRSLSFFKRPYVIKNCPLPFVIGELKYNNLKRNHTVIKPKIKVKFYSTNSKPDRKEENKLSDAGETSKPDGKEVNKLSEADEASKPDGKEVNKLSEAEVVNPGLFKRFKLMYRDYWYVLVPVHLITSTGWFGGFYYMAKSGVDVVGLLQSIGFSETWTNPLKDSSMGYLAISYALYKIATPVRYTVTLGGTTFSINYLRKWGYIKPVPSKEKLREIYNEKRHSFRETIQETKEELRQRKDQLRERKDNIMGDYVHFKKELKDIKSK